jgi:hypothetical protein
VTTIFPLLTNALLVAAVALALSYRFITAPVFKAILVCGSFLLALLPITELSLAQALAGVFGNLSVPTVMLLGIYLAERCDIFQPPEKLVSDRFRLYFIVGISAIFLYPSALGLTSWDLYATGYYPVILAPLLLSVVGLSLWKGWYYLASILGLVFVGFGFNVFESDNLWDYLLDPMLSIYCLFKLKSTLPALIRNLNKAALEPAALFFAGSFLLFSIPLSRINHDTFRYQLVAEDGFTESSTAITLFLVTIICVLRILKLKQSRSLLFLGMTGFIGIVGLFGAGEEISWGQRIFGWETPEYFLEHNKQEETGLHNLVVEIDGEKLNLNKLIFGTGLAIGLAIYLFVMTPIYRRHSRRNGAFSRLIDNYAIPMPENYHIAGYLIVLACVELLIDSSKRGEMTEFAGSIIFLLNVAYPYNNKIFESDAARPES